MIFMILLHITLDITSLIVENNFPSWHQLHVKEAMSNNTLVSHLLLFKLMTRYWWIFYNKQSFVKNCGSNMSNFFGHFSKGEEEEEGELFFWESCGWSLDNKRETFYTKYF